MAMVIRIETAGMVPYSTAWRVGTNMREAVPPSMVKDVSEIEASDEELLNVLENTRGVLPILKVVRPGGMVRWYGDHARFIVGNL